MSLAAKSAPPPVSGVGSGEEEICSSRAARLVEVDSERRESSAWTRFWTRSSKSLVRVLSVCLRKARCFSGALTELVLAGETNTSGLACRAFMRSWEKRTGVSLEDIILVMKGLGPLGSWGYVKIPGKNMLVG